MPAVVKRVATAPLRMPPRQQCTRAAGALESKASIFFFASLSMAEAFGPAISIPTSIAFSRPCFLYVVPTMARSSSEKSGRLTAPGRCEWAYSLGLRTSKMMPGFLRNSFRFCLSTVWAGWFFNFCHTPQIPLKAWRDVNRAVCILIVF